MRRGELPDDVVQRRAIIYVRQSTGAQVHDNLESQRRQYELADLARTYGFRDVTTIDDDLGRSASGLVARPGFEALVAQLCQGTVGAVFCLEASRLARNGRDWHHMIELCGLVRARVIDLDGVYDPSVPNDRLLLGLNRPDSYNTSCSTLACQWIFSRFLWEVGLVGTVPRVRPSRRQM